jgi:hypothetical protein
MFQLNPQNFFATGLGQIEDGLNYVLQVAQTAGATRADSGLITPVPMLPKASAMHWGFPDGMVGSFIVIDHGFVLRKDQYLIDYPNRQIVLNYTPAQPYSIKAAWSSSKAGITPPVSLSLNLSQGPQFWNLPAGVGPNVLIFDTGRILRADEYTVSNGLVHLAYIPNAPYDISASWGVGSPGTTQPVILPAVSTAFDNRMFSLPYQHGDSVLIFDHGLMLSAEDYVVDNNTGVVTLSYNPAVPYNVSASWGYPMVGVYFEDVVPTPSANGVALEFAIPQDPVTDTVTVKCKNPNGTITVYSQNLDFIVTGRKIIFTNPPPAGGILLVSMMTLILKEPLSVSRVNGLEAFSYDAPGVGTYEKADALIGTDPTGKLPESIIPISKVNYNSPLVGQPLALDKVPALDPNGKLVNGFLPANPQLGLDNNSVTVNQGVSINQSTLTQTFIYNTDGSVSQILFKNGTVTVKQISFTYNSAGLLITTVEQAGGKTLTRTFNYDSLDNVTSISSSIS